MTAPPDVTTATVQEGCAWWALRVERADWVDHHIVVGAEALAELMAEVSGTGIRVLVSRVTPSELAALRIDQAFPAAPSPSSPASAGVRAAPGVPTAEEVATWGPVQIRALLDRALVTEAQACREMSRAAGGTVGLADVRGRPDLAEALLAFCAQPGRRSS